MDANKIQIGGDHYKGGGTFEHWDVIARQYGPGYFIAAASKYVQRWRKKNGRQDLEKARHYLQKLCELMLAGVIENRQLRPLAGQQTQMFLDANGVFGPDRIVLAYILEASERQPLEHAIVLIDRLLLNVPDAPEA